MPLKIRYPLNFVLNHSYFIIFSVFSTCRPLRGQDGPVDQVLGGGHGGVTKTSLFRVTGMLILISYDHETGKP